MMTNAQLRAAALDLPEVEERETWGSATVRVRDKIFVIVIVSATSGTTGKAATASMKASREDQGALAASEPERYSISEYTGRFGWVTARLANAHPDEVRDLVIEAWRRTSTKPMVAKFDAERAQKD